MSEWIVMISCVGVVTITMLLIMIEHIANVYIVDDARDIFLARASVYAVRFMAYAVGAIYILYDLSWLVTDGADWYALFRLMRLALASFALIAI